MKRKLKKIMLILLIIITAVIVLAVLSVFVSRLINSNKKSAAIAALCGPTWNCTFAVSVLIFSNFYFENFYGHWMDTEADFAQTSI